jgi:hypothetical protein
MWELRKVRSLVSGMLARQGPARRVSGGPATDWLPPVLGPSDWSVGMMADRGAGWYFDRN